MFSLVSGIYESYLAPPQLNVLIVGSPGSGKTALLERLKATQLPKRATRNSSNSSVNQWVVRQVPPSVLQALLEAGCGEEGSEQQHRHPSHATTNTSSHNNRGNGHDPYPMIPATASNSSANSVLLPPIIMTQKKRRMFPISICPAPERYKQAAAAADEDEEFVYDDDDDEEETDRKQQETKQNTGGPIETTDDGTNRNNVINDEGNAGYNNNEDSMIEIPLDTPLSPKAPHRVRLHSREFSTDSLDLSNEDVNDYTQQEERRNRSPKRSPRRSRNKLSPASQLENQQPSLEEPSQAQTSSAPVKSSPKLSTTATVSTPAQRKTNKHPLHQVSQQEYDLKPGGKALPLSKIRPTIGTNLAKLDIHGAQCRFFDVGGKMQKLWERYYDDCDAVIFCWKVQDDPNKPPKKDGDDDDDDDEPPFDMTLQKQLLNQVRQSIPDDVPFLIFGHVFGCASEGIVNNLYNTNIVLPRYHNPMTAMCCGSAKTGAGMAFAMEWLIPLAKRLQKERFLQRQQADAANAETKQVE